MKVLFYCGPFEAEKEFDPGTSDKEIGEAFEVWLFNRSDIGYSVMED